MWYFEGAYARIRSYNNLFTPQSGINSKIRLSLEKINQPLLTRVWIKLYEGFNNSLVSRFTKDTLGNATSSHNCHFFMET